MEANPSSTTNLFIKRSSKRWAVATVMLLSASLFLAACGDGGAETDETTSGGTTAGTGAATVAVETPESDDAEATPVAESTEVIETETGLITETEVLTETEVTTDVNVTEVTTNTVVTTDTVEGGEEESAVTSETEVITDSEELEATATPSAEVTDTEEMTGTEGTGTSETMTGTGSTGAAATGAGAAAASNMGVSGVQNRYVRGSTLLDYSFENQGGEVSGDLEDLLIDLSTGRVLFASIEYGGVLDLGDKDIVVPLNAFTSGAEGELVLNIDEATLENYPDVGNDWPDLNDPTWDDDVSGFWTESGIEQGAGFEEATTTVAWLSELMDDPVADLGAGVGSIVDVLVDLNSARAPYLIVDYGEGLDSDPYIIPLAAFDTSNREAGLVYGPDFTPDLLENAPRFDQDLYPAGTPLDNDFGDQFESAWNDMGFSNDLNNDGQND